MKMVITGGAGFIGSHTAELFSDNYEVTVIDDLTTGKTKNLEGIPIKFIKGSIQDKPLLEKEFRDASCIVHQAAFVSVQNSISDPLKTHEINATGTLNVLCAARDAGVEKVIFASSAAVYGDSLELPKREGMVPEPVSPYAASKMAGEYYCRVFHEQYGLKTVCLRYFNVYGPRQNPSSAYAAVIPLFINRMLSKRPLIIYGDGTQTRDFIFVRDVVSAIKSGIHNDFNGTVNIATEKRTSINDLVEMLRDLLNIDPDISHALPRPGDIHDSVADISLARKALGFKPEYSMREGLKVTIEWLRRHSSIVR